MQPQPNSIHSTMEQQHEPDFFSETKDLLKKYVSDRIALVKLLAIEKVSTIAAGVAAGVVLAILGLFFLVFLSITLGFFLAGLLSSNTAGFGIVAGFYLLLIIIIIAFGKKIFGNMVTKKIIQNSFKKKDGQQ